MAPSNGGQNSPNGRLAQFPATPVSANLNRILRASTARFVLLLNTDMFFDVAEPCVLRMVRFMHDTPHCGISGCGLYHENGEFAYPARRFQI